MVSKLKLKRKKFPPPIDYKRTKATTENFENRKLVPKFLNNRDESSKNLCYVNATLQLIFCNKDLKDYFEHLNLKKNDRKNMPICFEIAELIPNIGKLVQCAANIRSMVSISSKRPDLCDGSQQDVMEFHNILMTVIRKEMEKGNDNSGLILMDKFIGKTKFERKFAGENGKCKYGHIPVPTEDSIGEIILKLPDTIEELSLTKMIWENYTADEEKIIMKCNECCPHKSLCPQTGKCQPVEAYCRKTLITAPKYLYIHLLRFPNHLSKRMKNKVNPEPYLVLPNGQKFKLIAIVNHTGETIMSGHYQAVVKHGSDWIMCNDDMTQKSMKTTIFFL